MCYPFFTLLQVAIIKTSTLGRIFKIRSSQKKNCNFKLAEKYINPYHRYNFKI